MPHRIRLRGPWHYQALARTRRQPDGSSLPVPGELPPPGSVQLPADWGDSLGADFRGRVQYLRRFNQPTGLEPGDRIELVIERVDAFASVELNGVLLGTIPPGQQQPFRADVTQRLNPGNLLSVEVELPECPPDSLPLPRGERSGRPGGLTGEVRLEIHPAVPENQGASSNRDGASR